MVLINRLFIGIVLLVTLTSTSTSSIRRHRQIYTPTSTTTPNSNSSTTKNVTESPIPKSQPKIDPMKQYKDANADQTQAANKTEEDVAGSRQDNARSLNINVEKYMPEFHHENNVYPENKDDRESGVDYETMFKNLDVTTPGNFDFDERHRAIKEEISKSMAEKDRMFTSRDFDDHKKKIFGEDTEFDTYLPKEEETKMNETDFRHFDGGEPKIKMKVHRDYNMEVGKRTEMIKSFNETKIFEGPEENKAEKKAIENASKESKENSLKALHSNKIEEKTTKVLPITLEPSLINLKTEDLSQHQSKHSISANITNKDRNFVKRTNISTTTQQNMVSKPIFESNTTRGITKTTQKSFDPKTTLKPKTKGVKLNQKPALIDLEGEPSSSHVHVEKIDPILIKTHILNNTIDSKQHSNLNKELLSSINPDDKGIMITKRGLGAEDKQKTTISIDNLEESNVVEVTTTSKKIDDSKTSTIPIVEGPSKKIESSNMMVHAYSTKETTTLQQPFILETDKNKENAPIQNNSFNVGNTESDEITTQFDSVTEAETLSTVENFTFSTNTDQETTEFVTEARTETTTEKTTDKLLEETTRGFDLKSTTAKDYTTENEDGSRTTEINVTTPSNFGLMEDAELEEEILTNATQVPPDNFFAISTDNETTFFEVTTPEVITESISAPKLNHILKKNDSTSSYANEITKIAAQAHNSTTEVFKTSEINKVTTEKPKQIDQMTTTNITDDDYDVNKQVVIASSKGSVETTNTTQVPSELLDKKNTINENDIIKQNEININDDKSSKATTEEPFEPDEDDQDDEDDDDTNKKNPDIIPEEPEENLDKMTPFQAKVTIKPVRTTSQPSSTTQEILPSTKSQESGNVYNRIEKLETTKPKTIESDVDATTIPGSLMTDNDEEDGGGNGGKIAAIVISTVGGICLFLLVGLLIIMRKRQKRFNYGQRCRPVSLDAYSMDNVSIHNSTRRKGVLMASKRSYGNPAFDDPNCPSHPLNFSELVKFANNDEEINAEFEKIPQVQAKTSELPEGCEIKNRYANVIPLPESRVFLTTIDGYPNSDYINANYVTGAKGQRRYYIACQAPMQNTIEDFWRMIWEQESKVVLMLTHLYEHGVEKCIDYLPPSEVLDCHRLFGDYQITLKKREVRDKYIISSLQLKNMVSNSWREVTHIWYMEWPHKGVPEEANSMIRFLIEARSYVKSNENKAKEGNTSFINGSAAKYNPVIVHCSPGTGRTGTVIACDIAIREFELSRTLDIPKIVYKIRRDRASSVQTKEQYFYIYNVINLYATKLAGGAFDSF